MTLPHSRGMKSRGNVSSCGPLVHHEVAVLLKLGALWDEQDQKEHLQGHIDTHTEGSGNTELLCKGCLLPFSGRAIQGWSWRCAPGFCWILQSGTGSEQERKKGVSVPVDLGQWDIDRVKAMAMAVKVSVALSALFRGELESSFFPFVGCGRDVLK